MNDNIDEQVNNLIESNEALSKDEKKLKRKVRFRNIAIVALIIIIILLLLKGCGDADSALVNLITKPEIEDATLQDKVAEDRSKVDMFVLFPAVLTETNPYYDFGVSHTNYGKFYIQITVTEDGNTIYQSKMCEATSADEDYAFSVDLYSLLGKGTHDVVVEQQGFYYDSLEPTNKTSQDITITCK